MNIMSMESIFLMLSAVILFAGILYWFWRFWKYNWNKLY